MKSLVLFLVVLLFMAQSQVEGPMDRVWDRFRNILGVNREGVKSIEVTTSKSVYAVGEKVEIMIKNNGSSILEGTPSYRIYDSSDREIFSPMMAQVITTLGVNESTSFTWNQIDNSGKQAKEGTYRVEVSFAGLNGGARFEIKGSYARIGDIIAEPQKYEGKEVMIKGRFMGWSLPEEHEIVTPMITRSDWILDDESGAMYVTKLNPEPLDPMEDVGRKVIVSGIIRLQEGKPYLEGRSLRVI